MKKLLSVFVVALCISCSQGLPPEFAKNTAIDISGLPRGVYYITIEKQILKHKIIKI